MSKSYFDETHCAIGHPKSTFMQWMLTIDHKRIGIMYAAVMFTFFFVAVFVALAMRLELFAPGAQYMDGDTCQIIRNLLFFSCVLCAKVSTYKVTENKPMDFLLIIKIA